jgi:hypothetical protein
MASVLPQRITGCGDVIVVNVRCDKRTRDFDGVNAGRSSFSMLDSKDGVDGQRLSYTRGFFTCGTPDAVSKDQSVHKGMLSCFADMTSSRIRSLGLSAARTVLVTSLEIE